MDEQGLETEKKNKFPTGHLWLPPEEAANAIK
jgi:hypothetical protein